VRRECREFLNASFVLMRAETGAAVCWSLLAAQPGQNRSAVCGEESAKSSRQIGSDQSGGARDTPSARSDSRGRKPPPHQIEVHSSCEV